jgi:hypothetical protein
LEKERKDEELEKYLIAVGGTPLTAKQRETLQQEAALKIQTQVEERRKTFEENRDIFTVNLFKNPGIYIDELLIIKIKNNLGRFDETEYLEEKETNDPNFRVRIAMTELEGKLKFDALLELRDLNSLMAAIEKECRHLDTDIDHFQLKTKFYSWSPPQGHTLDKACDNFTQLINTLKAAGIVIEEAEQVSKLTLELYRIQELQHLMIDLREKSEKGIGPKTLSELISTVKSYVKHMNLVISKSNEHDAKDPRHLKQSAHMARSTEVQQRTKSKDKSNNREKCSNCGRYGHLAINCRSAARVAQQVEKNVTRDPRSDAIKKQPTTQQTTPFNNSKKGKPVKTIKFSDLLSNSVAAISSDKQKGEIKKSAHGKNYATTTDASIFNQFSFSTRATPIRAADKRKDGKQLDESAKENAHRKSFVIYDTGATVHIVNNANLLQERLQLSDAIAMTTPTSLRGVFGKALGLLFTGERALISLAIRNSSTPADECLSTVLRMNS